MAHEVGIILVKFHHMKKLLASNWLEGVRQEAEAERPA